MRRPAAALALAGLLVSGLLPLIAAPVMAAAPINPKVVIIVGPVSGSTAGYISDANAAYTEARKYTTNVLRFYSPNATWAQVRPALQGASIVIYLGHGNGSPGPYGPFQATQDDGFGLNAVANSGDSNTKYWGEYYLAHDVVLAPNAVVLLNHLCYASGNSEPQNAPPTLSVAKQRVDNFGAGFIAAGAKAVIAEGHVSPVDSVRALFTTRQSIDSLFRTSPNAHGHTFAFASSRHVGMTAEMDPDTTSGGYYRSIVGKMSLTTTEVTGASYAATDTNPATLVVPGAAEVSPNPTGLFSDTSLTTPVTSLSAGTRLRLTADAGVNGGGVHVYAVTTLDGSNSGFIDGALIAPRDSTSPRAWTIDGAGGSFSPNGDGVGDTMNLTVHASESVDWTVRFKNLGGAVLAQSSGSGVSTFTASWDGLVSAAPAPEGAYAYEIELTDGWGNPPTVVTGTFSLDLTPPQALTIAGASTLITPNGDGTGDSMAIAYSGAETGSADIVVRDAGSTVVRTMSQGTLAGSGSLTWDGTDGGAAVVPDGHYVVTVTPRDLAGNPGPSATMPVAVYRALRRVSAAPTLFFPQDGDAVATKTRFTFALTEETTVTEQVKNAAGVVVRTRYLSATLAAGTYLWDWDGKNDSGRYVARGTYRDVVTASAGDLSWTTTASVIADAFAIAPSDSTPGRGQRVTFTATSAEPLKAYPRLAIYQPGIAAYSVAMTRISTNRYRVTIVLHASSAGTMRAKVYGYDALGHSQSSTLYLPLH